MGIRFRQKTTAPKREKHLKRLLRSRFFLYLVAGSISFVLDSLVLLALLQIPSPEAVARLVFPVLSFECGVVSNYLQYHFWIWKDRRHETFEAALKGFFKYHLTVIITLLVKLAAMNLILEIFPFMQKDRLYYLLANFGAAGIAAISGFLLVNRYIFKHTSSGENDA